MLLALLLACFGEAPPAPVAPTGCAACHDGTPGGVHASVACVGCHLGDPLATNAPLAHVGLEAEPGALDTAARTCGTCHPTELARVRDSLMATGAGIISVDRWVFGEVPAPHGHEGMAELLALSDPTPAQDHLRRLCAGCHLGTRRDNRDDAVQVGGSGCSACHLSAEASAHPQILGVPTDAHCLGCHSRSGRISLSYPGLAEVKGVDLETCASPEALFDGRPGCRLTADVHHQAGLACVDCHLHTELMGDGTRHAHQEEQVELRCESCHGPDAAEAPWAAVDDPISRALLRLNGETRGPTEPARLGADGTPLWNMRNIDGRWWLVGKRTELRRAVPQTPQDNQHTAAAHARLSCTTCHSAWAPSCTSCHTAYDPALRQWDFGTGAEAGGAWVEHATRMGTAAPALGVDAKNRIIPAIPGMVSTLDKGDGVVLAQRLYAPASPHTTARAGRSCAGCHLDPVALGLGSGRLIVASEGVSFSPEADAGWVSLFPATPAVGTRPGFRSLDAEEQLRMLRVGACVNCHTEMEHPAHRAPVEARAQVLESRGKCGLPAGSWSWLR